MRRITASLATAALLFQPLAAFAFYETPGAVLQAVRFDASAKMFNAEVHGANGTTFISAWLKGQMQGTEYTDAKVNAQVTVDVVDTSSHMNGRFKGSVMILDGRLYAKLDTMQGTFEDEVILGTLGLQTKQWINFPVDADTVAQIQNAITQTGDLSKADDLYTMTRTPYQYGSSYTLTMNPADEEITSLQVKVDTDYKDAVQVSRLTFQGAAGDFAITGTAKAERMKTALSLTAPINTISFEMLMKHFEDLGNFEMFDTDVLPELDMDEEDWDEEWIEIDDEEDMPVDKQPAGHIESHPTLRRTLRENRSPEPVNRVDSGIARPSRRQIKTGNTNMK